MKIIQASLANLEQLIPLFDGYRVFYKQDSNPKEARAFLSERFQKNDSVIFLAINTHEVGLGFTQLYPSFSSVSMQRTYILNDIFTSSEVRKKGVGEALMEAAKQFAKASGSKSLTLETAINNPAQKLYKKLGWKKDIKVNHYTWTV